MLQQIPSILLKYNFTGRNWGFYVNKAVFWFLELLIGCIVISGAILSLIDLRFDDLNK